MKFDYLFTGLKTKLEEFIRNIKQFHRISELKKLKKLKDKLLFSRILSKLESLLWGMLGGVFCLVLFICFFSGNLSESFSTHLSRDLSRNIKEKQIVQINLNGIVKEYIDYLIRKEGKEGSDGDEDLNQSYSLAKESSIKEKTIKFGKQLEKTLIDFAEERKVILLSSQAVISGAEDKTQEIKQILKSGLKKEELK